MIILELDLNVNDVPEFLRKLMFKLNDLTIPLKQAGLIMMGSIDKNFRAQGRPVKWKPLKASTLRRRRGGGGKILQDTGRLKSSITFLLKGNNTVAIGTSVPYARVHQEGNILIMGSRSSIKTRKTSNVTTITIPQRKFLLFQKEDKDKIEKVFSKHIGKTAENVGLKFKG